MRSYLFLLLIFGFITGTAQDKYEFGINSKLYNGIPEEPSFIPAIATGLTYSYLSIIPSKRVLAIRILFVEDGLGKNYPSHHW